jgi:hypothetical protein
VTLQLNGREIPIDSRPSDALALAVRTGAPIFAAEDVITESAIEFEHEVEDTEEVVEKFKDFLDNVTPEDFATARRKRTRSRPAAPARRGPADAGRRPPAPPGSGSSARACTASISPVSVPYSCTCCVTTSPMRRIPSRIASSSEPEKLSRIELRPRPSRKAASPGTNATFSCRARRAGRWCR